jgi:hypothetical protein
MKRLRQKTAALEETSLPESCEVLAFKQVFASVTALIPELEMAYARDVEERQ